MRNQRCAMHRSVAPFASIHPELSKKQKHPACTHRAQLFVITFEPADAPDKSDPAPPPASLLVGVICVYLKWGRREPNVLENVQCKPSTASSLSLQRAAKFVSVHSLLLCNTCSCCQRKRPSCLNSTCLCCVVPLNFCASNSE